MKKNLTKEEKDIIKLSKIFMDKESINSYAYDEDGMFAVEIKKERKDYGRFVPPLAVGILGVTILIFLMGANSSSIRNQLHEGHLPDGLVDVVSDGLMFFLILFAYLLPMWVYESVVLRNKFLSRSIKNKKYLSSGEGFRMKRRDDE